MCVVKNIKTSYHDTGEETHSSATASVGCNVPVTHREEGDGYEPQGHIHVARRCLTSPAGNQEHMDWQENLL